MVISGRPSSVSCSLTRSAPLCLLRAPVTALDMPLCKAATTLPVKQLGRSLCYYAPMNFLEIVLTKLIGIERLLANRVMKASEYSFSQDYVFDRLHLWSQHLGDLKGKQDTHLLEIGSYEGRSAVWFLENILTHPSSTITCIDPFFSRMAEIRFDHNMAVSRSLQRIIKIKNRSQEVLKSLKESSY